MYLRRRAVAAALAVTAALSFTACVEADNGNNTLAGDDRTPSAAASTPVGGPQSSAPAKAGDTIDLEANDNNFVPKSITAPAGQIVIEMRNTGVAPHTFTNKDQLNIDVNANGGETAEIKLTDVKPGTYKIICTYHESIGMVGELVVT